MDKNLSIASLSADLLIHIKSAVRTHFWGRPITQLIFAQTSKISFQEVFFLSSRPVPLLWGPPGLISGIKLFLRE